MLKKSRKHTSYKCVSVFSAAHKSHRGAIQGRRCEADGCQNQKEEELKEHLYVYLGIVKSCHGHMVPGGTKVQSISASWLFNLSLIKY